MSDWEAVTNNEWVAAPTLKNSNNALDVLRSLGLEKEADQIENKQPINRKGISGVLTGVAQGAYNAVPAGAEFLYDLPGNIWESGKLAYQNPELAKRYAKAGLASGVGGILNIPANIVDYAKKQGIAPSWLDAYRPEKHGLLPKDFDYLAAEGLTEPNKGGEFIYGASQFAPNALFGPLSPTAWAIGQNENPVTAQLMPKVSHAITKPIANKVISTVKNIDLTPSGLTAKYFKDNISLHELADNMRAAEGTNTGLGDVVKSPKLKRQLENDLAQKESYGVEQTYKKINDQIQQKADKLLFDEIGKGLPDQDTNPMVKDVLRKSYEDNRTIKNNLYNEVSKLAKNEALTLDLDPFIKLARENIAAINESPLLKTNSDFRNSFNKLLDLEQAAKGEKTNVVEFRNKYEKNLIEQQNLEKAQKGLHEMRLEAKNDFESRIINQAIKETETKLQKLYMEHTKLISDPRNQALIPNESRNQTLMKLDKLPTIKDANIIANDLYDMGQQMLKSPGAVDRANGNLYLKLAKTLRESVDSSIKKYGSKELQKAANDAKNYYKDEFVQFLEKDLYKLLDETKNPDAIVQGIIKPSVRHDNAALIKKVQAVLPADQQGLLGYTYLRGALQKSAVTGKYELKPAAMKALVKSLGTKQFEALFPDENIRRAILDFTKLHDMNSEAASYLLNPKTGARNQAFLKQMAEYIPEIIIGGGAAASGGVFGAILGLSLAKLGKTASNKYLLDLLTSEEFRNKVGAKIQKRKGQTNKSIDIPEAKFAGATSKKEEEGD